VETAAVTGAFSYTGRYITRRLLADKVRVVNLTGHPGRPDPFEGRVPVFPLDFRRPEELARHLAGAEVLFNTYWIRFPRPPQPRGGPVGHQGVPTSHEGALENTRRLLAAARDAGVRRVVHISIANPSADSPLPYYRGKALAERALAESGMEYGILRPTVIFGGERPGEDVLINNIAWMLRRLPAFAVPGDGRYRIQPVHVEDVAGLAVQAGSARWNTVRDAAGPETYTFEELVRLVAEAVRSRARIVHAPVFAALLASRLAGALVRDVVLTRAEVEGLRANLLASREPPAGATSFRRGVAGHATTLGATYASELDRHYR
jgi:nucleoside-diphosphate-sugar epimerase